MELEHIRTIEEAIEMDSTWTTKKLVFKIDEVTIDIIPYLGGGPKSGKTLSFPNPPLLTQKELIGGFKWEAASQGVHLTQTNSSINIDSQHGHFIRLACSCHRLYYPTAATTKKRTDFDATMPPPSTKQE
jgi:hypothetical protein